MLDQLAGVPPVPVGVSFPVVAGLVPDEIPKTVNTAAIAAMRAIPFAMFLPFVRAVEITRSVSMLRRWVRAG